MAERDPNPGLQAATAAAVHLGGAAAWLAAGMPDARMYSRAGALRELPPCTLRQVPPLAEREVRCWLVPLRRDALPPGIDHWLDEFEREQMARLAAPEERERFTVAHAWLRVLLAQHLEATPESLRLVYGHCGKPALAGEFDSVWQFSLAYSGEWCVVAVARQVRVGIDLQQVHAVDSWNTQLASTLSKFEQARFARLPATQQREAFYCCRTRKEAYLKARGLGHRLPLSEISVSFEPGLGPALRDVAGDSDQIARWRLFSGAPQAGYQAALAVESQAALWLGGWRWQDGGFLPMATNGW